MSEPPTMTDEPVPCTNCGTAKDVRRWSLDLDLPTLTLCVICAHLMVSDRAAFERIGRKK